MSKRKYERVTAKVSKINNLENLTAEELKEYNKTIKALNILEDKYGKVSYREIKHLINVANKKGTVYKTEDRNAVFRYLHDLKYTADIVATYGRRGIVKGKSTVKAICVVSIYVVVRETQEVIFIDEHAWFNTDLMLEAARYYHEYGDIEGGMVFISRVKAMKYISDYKKNGKPTNKYQLSTLCKTRRAAWVQRLQKSVGIKMSIEEIRAML